MQIVDRICETFDVAREEGERDVADFLAELQEAGLIRSVEESKE